MSLVRDRFETASGSARLVGERVGAGHRPALVFLHAGMADRRSWTGATTALSGTFDAVAYDRRGFGESTWQPEPFSHVTDLVSVLDGLGLPTVWLVGSSEGGRIAVDAALAHPDRVAGLVLVAPTISGEVDPDESTAAVTRLTDLIAAARAARDLEAVNRHETALWLDGPSGPVGRVGGSVRALVMDMNGEALGAPPTGPERPAPPAMARLAEIVVPTLVVWGNLDLPVIRRRSAAVAASVGAGRTVVMEGTAHLPYVEQPSAFADLVGSFVWEAG